MAGKPRAEIEIAPSLIARLFAELHPDLAGHALRIVDHGWDYAVVRVGSSWVVRGPRRAVGRTPGPRRAAMAVILAPRLPVAVPAPIRLGLPSATFPWP